MSERYCVKEPARLLGDEGAAWHGTPTVEVSMVDDGDALPEWTKDFEPDPAPDTINHPPHYTGGDIECIDAIEAAAKGWPNWIAPHLANVMKYNWRAFKKGKALRDLRKARWYLDRAMEALLKQGYTEE